DAREKLNALHADNIARRSMVQIDRGQADGKSLSSLPAVGFDVGQTARMLSQGLSSQAQDSLFERLDQLLAEGRLDAVTLRGFYQDFMQTLYQMTEETGIDPKNLFDTAGAFELSRNAAHSV